MYIVYDAITGTNVGPFETHEDAQMFLLHLDEESLGSSVEELSIQEVVEPQQWWMDNSLEFLAPVSL